MKTLTRWPLTSGVALVAVLVAATLWLLPGSDDTARSGDQAITGLQWRVGSSQQYQLQFDSTMRTQTNPANAGQGMHVQMVGLLDMQTLAVQGTNDITTAVLGMRLADIELKVNGDSDPETNAALTAPFRVHFSASGLPEKFEFGANVNAQHRSMLENLVRTFQVSIEDGRSWLAQESNATGAYEAKYQRIDLGRVEKSKHNFLNLPAASMLADADISSTELIQLDRQHDWLTAMTINETIRTQGQGGLAIVVNNYAMLALQDIVQIVNAAELWQFVAAATPKTIPTVKTVPSISPEQARQQILAALPQLDATTNGRTTWIHRLRDLLRVDESLPGELLKAMQSQHFSDRTQADLYLAFELAGTESAQAALTSVIQNPDWSTRDAMRAIIALAGVKQPHVDTIEVLWETAETAPASPEREQLVSTATLALGSMGKTLRENSDANYDVLRDRLLTNATANGGPGVYAEKRTNYLYALSNTKDPTLTREVVYFLEDESPQVRRAAAMAVGSLDTDGVADHLLSRFSQEGNSEVRSAIVESLVNWSAPSKDSVATISAAIRNEADENTRLNMARFLGEHLQDFPDNGVILQELLRTEQSKRIRQNIADTLATAKHTANADGNSI